MLMKSLHKGLCDIYHTKVITCATDVSPLQCMYNTEYILELVFFIQEKNKRYPRGWLHTEGRARAFVPYDKVGGKCMLFLPLHRTHVMKGLQKKKRRPLPTAISFHIYMAEK